jgi:uncharacterized repeat protein (TIGR01451 family)
MKTMTQNHARSIGRAALVATALTVGMTSNAFAAGTLSGTSITNIATINYTVDGTPQPPTDTPVSEFVVDTIVNLLLIEDNNTHTAVAAGATTQATGFTLTNLGNAPQGYNLLAANSALGVFGEADAFDVTNFAYYIDVNNDGLLDGGDTLITSVLSVAPDGIVNLLVVADIPVSQTDNTASAISLTAVTTNDGTTTVTVESLGADVVGSVDIVFADPAIAENLATGTAAQAEGDATATALDQYHVATAVLAISKASVVYSDPANGLTNPKAIPGAILTYTITIVNNGTATATGISISDIVDDIALGTVTFNTQYGDGTTTCAALNGIAVKDGADLVPVCHTNVTGDDNADFGGGVANDTVLTTLLSLAAGETATMAFQVTIQ